MISDDKLTSFGVMTTFIFCIIFCGITILLCVFLILMYIFKAQEWRAQYTRITHLCVSIIILSSIYFIPKFDYIEHYYSNEQVDYSCKVIGGVYLSSRILISSFTTLIIFSTFIDVFEVTSILNHKKGFEVGIAIFFYVIGIGLTVWSTYGKMIVSNVGDCIVRETSVYLVSILIFLSLFIIQIFCIVKLFNKLKGLVQESEDTENQVLIRKMIYLTFAEIIIFIACSIFVGLQFLKKYLVIVLLGKGFECLSGIIVLLLFGYTQETMSWIKEICHCENEEINGRDIPYVNANGDVELNKQGNN